MLADALLSNALLAGLPIALASGLVGYFLVLRNLAAVVLAPRPMIGRWGR